MSPNSYEHINQPYDPVELISDLDLHTLSELPNVISGPWEQIIRSERVRRERSLDALRTYRPEQTETPTYDEPTPATYFAQARATNNSPNRLADVADMIAERKAVRSLAYRYLARIDVQDRMNRITTNVGQHQLADFFALNLYGVTGMARSIAFRAFTLERNAVLRSHFPGANLVSHDYFVYSLRQQPITPGQIALAESAVHAVAYHAPYPDFFQFSTEQQATIVETLGKEWETLCQIVHTSDPRLLTQPINRAGAPLAHLPASMLQEAITANPQLEPAELCLAFLRTPDNFSIQIAKLEEQAQAAVTFVSARGEIARVSDNQREIARLLASPDIRPEAQRLKIGQTVPLVADPSVPIPQRKFYAIIDNHLELIGRTYHEDRPNPNPRGVALYRWNNFNAGEALQAGFSGTLRGPTITRLPIAEDMLISRFGKYHEGINTENTYHLILSIEMKSSGRKPQTALLPILLLMRSSDTARNRIYKVTWKDGRSTGQLITESFRAEASAIARILEVDARSNAFSGGLPGLGKRQ